MSVRADETPAQARHSKLAAFGLAIDSEVTLPGGEAGGTANGEPVRVRRTDAHALRARLASGQTVLEREWGDGTLGMRVQRLQDDGYGVLAPGHGLFAVAPDGGLVEVAALEGPASHWHRPLMGQVLPLASVLSGFEVLHASAAVLDGAAVAISAPSNTGKSSLMINLVDRGARLLTDDVLSLRARDGMLMAHPGSPLANLSPEQLALLSPRTRATLGPPVHEGDKLAFTVGAVHGEPAPLRAFVMLRRSTRLLSTTFERAPAPDPRDLLASTFLPHVATPGRLRVQLDICATIARLIPVYRLQAPASVPASELAAVIETCF
jgi:hypothetical protein